MITTLKITTFLAALICVSLVGFVGAFGLKGDPDIEKFIAEPSFVDGLKQGNSNTKADSDEMSPLVHEAQIFAKRINPPRPPKPPAPKNTRPTQQPGPVLVKQAPKPPVPPRPPSAKFDVIALCRYEDDPGKSMALLNLRAKGPKWIRVGENVEHLILAEITDNGVIMSDNGRRQNPIMMKQTPSIVRSLLAEDAEAAAPVAMGMFNSPGITTSPGLVPPKAGAPVVREKGSAYVPPKAGVATSATARKLPINRPTTTRKPPVAPIARQPRTYTPGAGSRTTRRVPAPTVQERKALLDGNISELKKLVSKQTPGTTEGAKDEGVDALSKLLKLLEDERKEMKELPKNSDASTDKAGNRE
ncbi:MAG: hypothetical protein J7M40_06705 [Planctomycetes bacterium]|nr:hypothetical protein [Planctomycetota bacterium]